MCVCISMHTYIHTYIQTQTYIHNYMHIYIYLPLHCSSVCYKYSETELLTKILCETPVCRPSTNNCSHFAIFVLSLCMFLYTYSFYIWKFSNYMKAEAPWCSNYKYFTLHVLRIRRCLLLHGHTALRHWKKLRIIS